jgi:hypothetical protein
VIQERGQLQEERGGRPMDWKVELRLIKPNGEVEMWQTTLDQLGANELYRNLVADLRKKYPKTNP